MNAKSRTNRTKITPSETNNKDATPGGLKEVYQKTFPQIDDQHVLFANGHFMGSWLLCALEISLRILRVFSHTVLQNCC